MALGSQHATVLCVVTALMAVAAALTWVAGPPIRARSAASLLVLTACVLTGFTALQCIPIPAAWLAAIAPANADIWSRALSPFHEAGPPMVPLSVDPVATRVQVLRGAAYLGGFLAALRLAHRHEGLVFLERTLVAASLAMAAVALLHPALGAERVFGTYRPIFDAYETRHIAPLLNPNHLAAYLNIGMCVALGAALASRPTVPRPLAIGAVLLLVAVQLFASSRGGVISMVVSILAVLAISLASRRAEVAAPLSGLVTGAAALAGVGMLVLFSSETAWKELASTDSSKLRVLPQAMRLEPSFTWLGSGRGTFESVFPSVSTGTVFQSVTHPENWIVQFVVEWGVPLSLVAIACMAFALRPSTVLARSSAPVGAWGALVGATVHNLVDFNSEIPGVVLALTACAGLIVGGSSGAPQKSILGRWSQHPRGVVATVVLVSLGSIWFVLPGFEHELEPERRALRDRVLDSSLPREQFHVFAREAMLRHPAEPFLPYLGALRAAARRDESVLPWAARALERAPVYGRAHLLLARALFGSSPAQARLEYRLAYEQDGSLRDVVAKEAPRLVTNFDDAMELVATGPAGEPMLLSLVEALAPRLPATRTLLVQELRARVPESPAANKFAIQDALDELHAGDGAPWCNEDQPKCSERAMAASAHLIQLSPESCDGYGLRAELLAAAGDGMKAVDLLEQATTHVADPAGCARKLVAMAKSTGQVARAEVALEKLTNLGCATEAECVANVIFAAQTEEALGHKRRALAFYRKGNERAPERDDLLVEIARIAIDLDLHAEALDAYDRLARRQPGDARWSTGSVAEREIIMSKRALGTTRGK